MIDDVVARDGLAELGQVLGVAADGSSRGDVSRNGSTCQGRPVQKLSNTVIRFDWSAASRGQTVRSDKARAADKEIVHHHDSPGSSRSPVCCGGLSRGGRLAPGKSDGRRRRASPVLMFDHQLGALEIEAETHFVHVNFAHGTTQAGLVLGENRRNPPPPAPISLPPRAPLLRANS